MRPISVRPRLRITWGIALLGLAAACEEVVPMGELPALSTGSGTTSGSSSSGSSSASSTGGSTGGSTTGGCPLGGRGADCLTAAECMPGLVCTEAPNSTCQPPTHTPVPGCIGTGNPSDAGTCCGACVNDMCAPPPACTQGGYCQTDVDCCVHFGCLADAGYCIPNCGQLGASCGGGGTQCCSDLGLSCGSDGSCGYTPAGDSCVALACGVESRECHLGSRCSLDGDAGGDPCGPAGLVCDASIGVCRSPQPFESCLPGGPTCIPDAQSRVNLLCREIVGSDHVPTTACVQPCADTNDCASPLRCVDAGGSGVCVTSG